MTSSSDHTHTATHCNTLQYTATHCNTLQHTATHCNTLQHTATHCNSHLNVRVFGSAINGNDEQLRSVGCPPRVDHFIVLFVAVCCSVLQRVAACCSALQCVIFCVAVCCSVVQCGVVCWGSFSQRLFQYSLAYL